MLDLFSTLPPHYIECLPYTLTEIDKPAMSLSLLGHKLDSSELVIPLISSRLGKLLTLRALM